MWVPSWASSVKWEHHDRSELLGNWEGWLSGSTHVSVIVRRETSCNRHAHLLTIEPFRLAEWPGCMVLNYMAHLKYSISGFQGYHLWKRLFSNRIMDCARELPRTIPYNIGNRSANACRRHMHVVSFSLFLIVSDALPPMTSSINATVWQWKPNISLSLDVGTVYSSGRMHVACQVPT